MNHILKKYCPRIEFDSYEDFFENFKIDVPEAFNFGFDVVDEWARVDPEKRALVWCDDRDEERTFTFDDLSKLSNRAANAFRKARHRQGGRGHDDPAPSLGILGVRRGAVQAGRHHHPASLQLTKKDIVYRADSAQVKAVVCVNDEYVCGQMEEALPESPSIENRIIVAGERDGWTPFDQLIEGESDEFERRGARRASRARTSCSSTSRQAPRAWRKRCATTSPTRWAISSPRSTGSRWKRTRCT